MKFVEWLKCQSEKDTKVRAVLRRSLAFDPGKFAPAYPYVEPYVRDEENSWRREMHYLVAGLWAAQWRDGQGGQPVPLGKACAEYCKSSHSTSAERRFITLLDADTDQLPYRLRQMVALLKEQSIDFEGLLQGLIYWTDDRKYTQNAWARDFYRQLDDLSDHQ